MNIGRTADRAIRPTDVLATELLARRPERAPDLQAEVAAFCELSAVLADDPRKASRRFLEIALRLCNAGTAGLSVLRADETGETKFHWDALSGALALHEGGGTPRNFSPCGLCLDTGATILVSRPERVFTYLAIEPSIVEALIVPLYDTARRPLGTLWIAHHDPASTFCVNDVRIMEQLAIQLVLAMKLVNLLDSHQTEQLAGARDLAEERSRRERAEMSESGIRRALVFKDAAIQEAHHRVKNTIHVVASLLALQARATASVEARAALQESGARLDLLAKVHELLYKSADSADEIPMPTLLEAIGEALSQSFGEAAGRVRLFVRCDPLALSPDDAIPIALLANEAVTNAYKHAFPGCSQGEISVELRCTSANAVILQVKDSGVGMQSLDNCRGLGLRLMRCLAAQLGGSLDFLRLAGVAGTTVTLMIDRGSLSRRCAGDLRL